MSKRVAFILLLLCQAWICRAVDFRAVGPSQVPQNQPFQIQYIIDEKAKDIQPPSMPGFELLAGPFTSTSSSFSFINGKRTSTYQQTYTYTYMVSKPGTYNLGSATINVGGRKYRSNGLKISVVREEPMPEPQPSSARTEERQERASRQQERPQETSIFIRTVLSKSHVHEQEPLTLSYKLYFIGADNVQMAGVTKMPDFTGFLKQESDAEQPQAHLENYNGRQYNVATIYKVQLYPQHSGEIQITPAQFEVVYTIPGARQDPFGQLYGYQAHKTLKAPAVTVSVESLPQENRPKQFSGGVGHFTMTPSISATDLSANDPVTLRLDITGNGNMKLLKTPEVNWPEGFDVYDPKVNNSYQNTDSGMTGTKSIEYLAIPREPGEYTLPPVTLSYYDSETGSYRTLSTPSYTLHIKRAGKSAEAGQVSDYSQEDIRQLATDIRYIHTDELEPAADGSAREPAVRTGSAAWWACYLVPLLIAILVLVFMRKYIRENADITRVRYRKANKVARKRLRSAKQLMEAGRTAAFYEEIERAAVSYLSDRLTIPTAELTKETIGEQLRNRSIAEPLVQETLNVLGEAEFARYAPSAQQDMQAMYNRTEDLINQLENQKL
ncbi:MAG: protein BatD [Paludibacteraceae bacterium]|nr:protein BatD [Paludibacteraceae bacterium]